MEKLTDAENQLAQLSATDDDRAAAAEVGSLIAELNESVTLDDADAIRTARLAYDALSDLQKKLVTNEAKLTEAEYQLAMLSATAKDVDAAKAVEKKIAALKSPVTLKDEKSIKAARKAYDALSDTQKALVSNYSALTTAEHELALLKATDEDKEKAAEVEELIAGLSKNITVADEDQIRAAREAYDALTDLQKALVTNYARLMKAEDDLSRLQDVPKGWDIYKTTGDYIESLGDPDVSSQWFAIGLERSGREIDREVFYRSAVENVLQTINEKEQLHWAKASENARMILALTALGYDPSDVGGHNLLMGLTDMEYVKTQGINGPIWALIAFDSHNYDIPTNPDAKDQVTREKLITYLLDQQLPDGGWALTGNMSDSDISGMTLQALAPYYGKRDDVTKSVDIALETLSRMQNADGSYSALGGPNGLEPTSESISQILVALSALGIDADKDPRFIKNGHSVLDALCEYYVEGGGFKHLSYMELNGMATEQAYYALTAYYRMLEGKSALYDMNDVEIKLIDTPVTPEPTEAVVEEAAVPEETTGPEEEAALAVEAAAGEEEKSSASAWWIAPPVGIAGILAFLLDRKRRK